MNKYKVFISYRRSGFDTANLIAEKLRSMGYSVFFDVESLRGGKFNDQLFQVIDGCTDFVLVLPHGALDRCVDKDDWVRKEVTYAMLKGKNIVPVMLSEFTWPNPMPGGLEDLPNYQAVTASDRNTFDLAMQRLSGYLKAPRHNRILVTRVAAIIFVVLAVLAILFGILRWLSVPVSRQAATYLSYQTGLIHDLYKYEQQIREAWYSYQLSFASARTDIRKQELRDDFGLQIQQWTIFTAQIRNEIRPALELTISEKMLLASRSVFAMELNMMPEFVSTYCDDIDTLCVHLDRAITGAHIENSALRIITLDMQVFEYTANAYYYSYLSEMCHLPDVAKEMHRQLSPTWHLFPTEVEDQSESYYNKKSMKEMDKAHYAIQEYDNYLEQTDADIEIMEQQLDSLTELAEKVEQMQQAILKNLPEDTK